MWVWIPSTHVKALCGGPYCSPRTRELERVDPWSSLTNHPIQSVSDLVSKNKLGNDWGRHPASCSGITVHVHTPTCIYMHTNRMALGSWKFKSMASASVKVFLLHRKMWQAFHGESRWTEAFFPDFRSSLKGCITALRTVFYSNHLPRAPASVCHERICLESCGGLSLQHTNF